MQGDSDRAPNSCREERIRPGGRKRGKDKGQKDGDGARK